MVIKLILLLGSTALSIANRVQYSQHTSVSERCQCPSYQAKVNNFESSVNTLNNCHTDIIELGPTSSKFLPLK